LTCSRIQLDRCRATYNAVMNAKQRSALRARAHALNPVVIVGGEGLTAAVMAEIERNLAAHELIKVRIAEGDRDARESALQSICSETHAEPVQHIGKILVVFREAPPEPESRAAPAPRPAVRKKPARTRGAGPRRRTAPRNSAPRNAGRRR
jgi:RNA-binding protein